MKDEVVFKAIRYATQAHEGQYRKGTRVPYLIHPLRVAKILADFGASAETIAAGILHDTVEDTPMTLEDIDEAFGNKIAGLVAETTEPDKSATWETRKQHTLNMLWNISQDALLVLCADKLDNLREIEEDFARIGEVVWDRFRRPKQQQCWYYRALAEFFRLRAEGHPREDLFRAFTAQVDQLCSDD